jgi:hypothetical protein
MSDDVSDPALWSSNEAIRAGEYRKRAQEIRTIVGSLSAGQMRDALLQISVSYDRMAAHLDAALNPH